MAQTRTRPAPAPSPVDAAPLERESPLRVRSAQPDAGDHSVTSAKEGHVPAVSNEPPTRVGRLSRQLSGLTEDLKEVAALRVALAKAEVTERVEFGVGRVKQGSAAGLLVALCALFLLVAGALGIGAWLGHAAWGFLAMAGLLLLGAVAAWLFFQPSPPTTQK